MATYVKFQQFVEDLAHGVHDLETDQLVVALMAGAPSVSLDAVLADITQINYANLSSRLITTSSGGQTSGTYRPILADLTLTASGAVATFRYIVIYNDTPTTPADPLIGYYDHGSNVTLANGETLTVDFDGTNGLFGLA
ncbi:hypothetical protein HBA54_04815 [Pelagibius litoralis]|uniref:Uncharacterized protein n=1 Tax=Pelagibius litoralis TaxID=374515 RepID=A0A967EV29_9PROT|nr:hypothetical protein [Pelagibius litoralis]NIA67907.1 hypothetical protein [Pelagibius litoralis]